jgi:protein-disulfide isomerase
MNTQSNAPRDDIPPAAEFSSGRFSPFAFLGIGVIFLLAGLGIGYLLWGKTTAVNTNAPVQNNLFQSIQENDAVWGPADAPITIIEFSDFQCPYCRKWQAEVWPELVKAYPGQIRFIYRDFPLVDIHPDALPAAEASECAHEQGKYWEYHDKLFSDELSLGSAAYETYASELGLNVTQFKTCLSTEKFKPEIEADLADGQLIGIEGTPTFIINGTRVVGAQPLESFKEIIDKKLLKQ